MKKILLIAFAAFFLCTASAIADSFDIISEDKLPSELNGWLIKTICVEGHVFLVSYVLAGSAGAGVHAVQVYEERDGKSMPMRCKHKRKKK